MARLDLTEKELQRLGLQQWHYRCFFQLIFCVQEFNDLFGEPNELQFKPVDLTGATVRFLIREKREDLPAKAAVYDFEGIQGGSVDPHLAFDADPTTGQFTVTWDEDDAEAKAGRYWYQVLLKIPGEKRLVRGEGFIDILPTVDPNAAVDPEV